jgi:hypothetical protein
MHIFQNLFSFEISEMAESKLYINYQQLYMSFTKFLIISFKKSGHFEFLINIKIIKRWPSWIVDQHKEYKSVVILDCIPITPICFEDFRSSPLLTFLLINADNVEVSTVKFFFIFMIFISPNMISSFTKTKQYKLKPSSPCSNSYTGYMILYL